jgi:signal transduction histidine kinase/ActR/RegA family two-component response regulator
MREWIHVIDSDYRIVLANKAYQDILQKILPNRERYLGQTIFEWAPFLQDKVQDEYRKIFETGEILSRVDENFVEDQRFIVETIKLPVVVQNQVRYVLTIMRDITTEVLMNEQLHNAKKMEALQLVTGGIAHDFNNILMGILTGTDLALMNKNIEPQLAEDLLKIKESARQMSKTVEDLSILSSHRPKRMEPMDISQIITKFLASPELLTRKKSKPLISIEFHVPETPIYLECSENQIYKAIMNLILNAFDAIENSGKIAITLQKSDLVEPYFGYEKIAPGQYCRIGIKDTGKGISPDLMKKIFEPFFTTKNDLSRTGRGLGLFVVWSVIKNHKGYVDVESQVGQGTTFSLFIPIRKDLQLMTTKTPKGLPLGNLEKILVVDDSMDQLVLVTKILSRLNYTPLIAASGEEAIQKYPEMHPDMILLDMLMPNLNGLDTMKKILEINPQQPIIICSGFAHSDQIEEARSLGAKYLQKPYQIQDLAEMLHGLFSVNLRPDPNTNAGDQ